MASSHAAYLDSVRATLTTALCLHPYPSCVHSQFEVEYPTAKELSLKPIEIIRSPQEMVLMEPTINSVRVSMKIRQNDELEGWLMKAFLRLITQSAFAEAFRILRRVPVAGYDLSFVITSQHVQEYNRAGLVDACCNFLQESIAATEMKLLVSARGRAVASSFLGSLR